MASLPDRSPAALRAHAIVQGRAKVQIIQAAEVLLTAAGGWTERALLQLVIALYRHRLRQTIAHLPPEWSSEILAGVRIDDVAPDG